MSLLCVCGVRLFVFDVFVFVVCVWFFFWLFVDECCVIVCFLWFGCGLCCVFLFGIRLMLVGLF